MRMRLSKSFKGFRITASRSGLSFSQKVGPIRIGTSTRGRSWISASRKGFSLMHSWQHPKTAKQTRPQQERKQALPPAIGRIQQEEGANIMPRAQSLYTFAAPVSQTQPFRPDVPPLHQRHYTGRELLFMSGGLAILILSSGVESAVSPNADNPVLSGISATGALLWLVALGYALIVDTAGVGTLRGVMRWTEMSHVQRTWAIIAWVCLWPFFLFFYSGRIIYDWQQDRKRQPQERALHIAKMEADLGIAPALEGECAHCHKLLPTGAVFCTYCGTEVAPKAKVCPVCATLAPPDGTFCPRCRTALA
jgi:RNA polymerase subunit RPABC4/transcription elongation factor Spt4